MKATPPNGVMTPTVRTPVTQIAYRLPENSKTPNIKSQPAARTEAEVQRVAAHATAKRPSA